MTHEDIKNVAHLVMAVVLIGKSSHRLIEAHVLKTQKKCSYKHNSHFVYSFFSIKYVALVRSFVAIFKEIFKGKCYGAVSNFKSLPEVNEYATKIIIIIIKARRFCTHVILEIE